MNIGIDVSIIAASEMVRVETLSLMTVGSPVETSVPLSLIIFCTTYCRTCSSSRVET